MVDMVRCRGLRVLIVRTPSVCHEIQGLIVRFSAHEISGRWIDDRLLVAQWNGPRDVRHYCTVEPLLLVMSGSVDSTHMGRIEGFN